MSYSNSIIDNIKNRLPLSKIVGQYVNWDSRKSRPAKRDYWGRCPFHNEKTASFHVDDNKGLYYCFGCQATGDIFRFMMEKDRLSFPEVLKYLADMAGVVLPQQDSKEYARAKQEDERVKKLLAVMATATTMFRHWLHHRQANHALSYLQNVRKLQPQIIDQFAIGYAPADGTALLSALTAKGFAPELLEQAGLIFTSNAASNNNNAYKDRFRDRLIFPIHDRQNRVIAFGGRALNDKALAKYLNSPETRLFAKKNTLYNLTPAVKTLKGDESIIVVEGYMDVISMTVAGFTSVVAPLGTAISEQQLAAIWRFNNCPTLCFDGDEAGRKAAVRAVERALPLIDPDKTLKIALLPANTDPDDLIRQQGVKAMGDILASAMPLADMLWQYELTKQPLDTPEQRANFEIRINEKLKLIKNSQLHRHYQLMYKEKTQSLFASFYKTSANKYKSYPNDYNNRTVKANYNLANYNTNYNKGNTFAKLEDIITATLIHRPDLLAEFAELIVEINFLNNELKILVGHLIKSPAANLASGQNNGFDLKTDELKQFITKNPETNAISAHLEARLNNYPEWRLLLQESHDTITKRWQHAVNLYRHYQCTIEELDYAQTQFEFRDNGDGDGDDRWEDKWHRLQQAKQELNDVKARIDKEGWFGSLEKKAKLIN